MQRVLLVAPSDQLSRAISSLAAGMDATISTVREHAAAWKALGEFGADRVIVDATADRNGAFALVQELGKLGARRPPIVLVGTERDQAAFAAHRRLRRHADVYLTEWSDLAAMLRAPASGRSRSSRSQAGPVEFTTGTLAVLAVLAVPLLGPSQARLARWALAGGTAAAWVSGLLWMRRLPSWPTRALVLLALVLLTAGVVWVTRWGP